MNNKFFNNKVAIITGAASGMGKKVATRLAECGTKVGLFDLDSFKLEKTKQQIEKQGGEAIIAMCDIANEKEVEKSFNKIFDQWGQLDIVFANAGIAGSLSPIETMNISDWDKTLQTNLTGTFLTTKFAIPYLKNNGGNIIITSSVSGNRTFSQAGFSAYSTSKSSQVAFVKMAALELSRYNIRVNAICPGGIKTNIGESIHKSDELKEVEVPIQFPEGSQPLEHGPGNTKQIADLIQFLASDEASHITGTEIYIDGAESLLRG